MLSFFHLVKETIAVVEARLDDGKEIVHIAYGADINFALGTAVSAVSVLHNSPQVLPHFHLFTDRISEDFIDKFRAYGREHAFSMTVYLVDTDKLAALPVKARWPSAIYFRIVAIDYLASRVARVLYLDSDITCCADIAPLISADIGDNAVAACLDIDFIDEGDRVAKLNAPEVRGKYFNSGVLLVNTRAWQDRDISARIARGLCDPQIKDALLYYDQDLINIAVAGRVTFLDGKYNTQYSLNDEYKGPDSALPADITFLHYIGATKPWHEWAEHYASADYFMRYKACSPWNSVPLVKPHKKILWRHALKHARHQGNIGACLKYAAGLVGISLKTLLQRAGGKKRADAAQPLQNSKALR